MNNTNKKYIFLLIGASGSGKTYFANKICGMYPNLCEKVITATSRAPRDGEFNGIDYHFKNIEFFNSDNCIEFEQFGANFYGTPKQSLNVDKNLFIAIEPNGCLNLLSYIQSNLNETKIPFIIYFKINENQRINNMKKRGDSDLSIQKRIGIDNIDAQIENLQIQPDITIEKNDSIDFEIFAKKFILGISSI